MKEGQKFRALSFISYGLVVMTVTHTLTHVFGGIHTSIFSLLRTEFNLSLQQLGIIAAIPPLCQALFTIPTGLLSDRFGSKRMLLVSFTVAIIGAIMASQARSPFVFILAISLVYVNNAIYHPASYSFTANAFTMRDRPKALGLHGAGGTLGHSIGPLSVSILIGMLAFGWRQVYLILTVPILLGVVMVLLLKEGEADLTKEDDTSKVKNDGLVNEVRSLL
jgi:MFS family permease